MTTIRPALISAKEAADYFGKSLQTIERWLRSGELAGVKVGRTWYISEDEVAKRVTP